MSARENPFERFGLDPHEGPSAITQRMRDLVEEATSEAERAELREVWEELTLHPARRLKAALFAHPDPEPREGAAPPPPPLPPPREALSSLSLYDLALLPDVEAALGESARDPGRKDDDVR